MITFEPINRFRSLEVYFSSRYVVYINLLLSSRWTQCQVRLGWNAGPQDLVDSGLPAGNSPASAARNGGHSRIIQ